MRFNLSLYLTIYPTVCPWLILKTAFIADSKKGGGPQLDLLFCECFTSSFLIIFISIEAFA